MEGLVIFKLPLILYIENIVKIKFESDLMTECRYVEVNLFVLEKRKEKQEIQCFCTCARISHRWLVVLRTSPLSNPKPTNCIINQKLY